MTPVRRAVLAGLAASFLAAADPAGAVEIRSYQVRMQPAADRSGDVSLVVRLADASPGPIAIPIGFTGVTNLRVTEAPPGALVALERGPAQTLLRASMPEGTAGAATIAVRFAVRDAFRLPQPAPGERPTLPAGSQAIRNTFLNSQPAAIAEYRLDIVFPEGTRAHAVREALPKLRKNEAGPRALLLALDGRPGVRLSVEGLQQGETASMRLELVPRARPLGWLAAGLVLAALYLVAFRDLVAARR